MIISQTPLRLSLLGGNTDFKEYYLRYGGFVVTSTIDKYVYCIVKKRFDDLIYVNWSIKEKVEKVDDIKHDLVREALKLLSIKSGIEITFLADIPTRGTGLGSSSSVTVGLLNCLHNYLGHSVGPFQLAEEAVKIEVDILGKPIGVQDQYAVALGGIRAIQFSKRIDSHKINIFDKEDFNNSLMLLYTDIERKSDDILSELDIKKNMETLNNNKLLAIEGSLFLSNGHFKQFGGLLDEYWQHKKKLSNKITNSKIDKMYSKAKKAGAIGGKVIGAGGGGFLLVMFPANKRAKVREALKDYKELPFRFTDHGSRIIFNV